MNRPSDSLHSKGETPIQKSPLPISQVFAGPVHRRGPRFVPVLIVRRAGWFFLPLLLSFAAACATAPTKPSPVAEQVDRIRQAVASITESYEKKDEKKFLSSLDPSFKSLPSFKEQVLQDLATFSEIDIDMKIDRVEVREGSISTAVHWGGVWKGAAGTPPLEKKGHALLVWTSGETPLLLEIRGDPPFGIFRGGI